MEIKQGVFTEIIFHNDENGYTIAEMETDDELLTVVGNLPSAVKGACYELTGTFKVHPRYGEQFAFTEAMEKMPTTRIGIEGFLASGVIKGIGPKTATAIVNIFGEDTLRVIDEEPEKLSRVPGIGRKKADAIGESFAEHREFADVSLFFQGYGVTAVQALRLYKEYGKDCVELIRENPYRLVEEVRGMGFRKADEIASKLGIAPDSPFRIKSGISYCLWYYIGDGNTYLPQDELCEKVVSLLDVTREQVKDNMVEMAFTGDIQVDNLGGVPVVYIFAYYSAEQKVCRNIAAINHGALKSLSVDIEKSIELTENATGVMLSEEQKSAVRKSLTSGISVITGGPGTGKTTILNTIINIFEESDFKVAIAAPTGRAAKRITETSGHYASTIHRLLEYYYSEGTDEMQFGKTADDPLEYDVVVVDEASMIDVDHFKRINDSCGHLCGDKALIFVAETLKKSCRKSDFIGRFGGDEFLMICHVDTEEAAGRIMRRIDARLDIERLPEGIDRKITVSAGCAIYRSTEEVTVDSILNEADKKMYAEKNLRKSLDI